MKRRQVLTRGAALAAVAVVGNASRADSGPNREHTVDIRTPEGACRTFIVHPRRGGPHPVIVIYMDAAGIREQLRDMARRLATVGYYVLLPNLYYRSGVLDLGPADVNQESAWFKRAMSYQALLTVPRVMSDTDAVLAYVDTQKAAKKGPTGLMGFCMTGPYVIQAAARHPERIAAAAVIHGTSLVTKEPDSPVKVIPTVKGALYFGFAGNDRFVLPDVVEAVRAALAANPDSEVDVYSGVQHGFAFPERYSYDKAATEQLWTHVDAFFKRYLG